MGVFRLGLNLSTLRQQFSWPLQFRGADRAGEGPDARRKTGQIRATHRMAERKKKRRAEGGQFETTVRWGEIE